MWDLQNLNKLLLQQRKHSKYMYAYSHVLFNAAYKIFMQVQVGNTKNRKQNADALLGYLICNFHGSISNLSQ